jgi:hypothetical protein
MKIDTKYQMSRFILCINLGNANGLTFLNPEKQLTKWTLLSIAPKHQKLVCTNTTGFHTSLIPD